MERNEQVRTTAVRVSKTDFLSREAASLWTTQDVVKLFRVTPMTISNWFNNPPLGRDPIPVVEIRGEIRGSVRFVPEDVVAWATRHDIPMYKVRGLKT